MVYDVSCDMNDLYTINYETFNELRMIYELAFDKIYFRKTPILMLLDDEKLHILPMFEESIIEMSSMRNSETILTH